MAEKKGRKKIVPVLLTICLVLLLAAAAVYGGGIVYYQEHFLRGTVIDRVDASNKTVEELTGQAQDYLLRVIERKADGTTLEEDVTGAEIGLSYASAEPLEKILREQNRWLWFLEGEVSYETEDLLLYDEEALEKAVRGFAGFQDGAAAPADARISEYSPETGFSIIPETRGNQLKWQETLKAVKSAVDGLEELVDLQEAGCYQEPRITADHEQLVKTLSELQDYADVNITYVFGDNKEVLDGSVISSWLYTDGFQVKLDQEKVKEYVAALRKRYDTIFRSRNFITSYGKEITIDTGDYGWWMNYGQEGAELAEMILNKQSGERTPVYYQTAASYGTPDYGNTYVEINLTAQHLFLYEDGELVLESDFVSGNSSRGYDTPDGVYGITYKQRNATLSGEDYETPVSYWMPFNRNIGMHDAGWRRSFGGDIYKTGGSHGCINLPPAAAREIYERIEKGTPVICYHLAGTENFGSLEK